MADIREVAKAAGVSISTVSRVVNRTKAVSDPLRERVERTIRELGYSPNSIARGLKSVETKNIAVIITSIARTFFVPVLEGITQEAEKYGYVVQILETHDSAAEEMRLVDFAVSQWVDGIILASSAYGDDPETLDYLSRLSTLQKRGEKIPVVSIEYALRNDAIDAVAVDHRKAARDATAYLIQRIGRRRIVHLSLPRGHYMGALRVEGYRQALQENGIEFSRELLVEGDYTTFCGYRTVNRLLKKGIRFDAVFCANDQMAVGALRACEDAGLRVPEDAAVMGYDDIITASLIRPSLSSVVIPKYEIGLQAVRQLICCLHKQDAGREVLMLETRIVERESTRRGAYQSLENLRW